jgi:predicted amidohydrolase YtcJ
MGVLEMRPIHKAAALLVAFTFLCLPLTAAEHADRIFVNGNIWTEDEAHPHAEALAISGDRLLAVGSNAEIRALAVPDTAVLDLHGRLVIPGFQDSHLHFPGPSVNEVDLVGADTLQQFQQRIAGFAKSHRMLPWIVGAGWGYALFPNQKPDKKYLDSIVSDRPVYVSERDGHMGLANSKALTLAGITGDTPDPPNGRIMRDGTGQPTGELKEAAQELITSHIPPRSDEDRYESLLQHMDEAASYGLTAVQDAALEMRDWPVFERALAAGKVKLRFRFAPLILPTDGGFPKNHKLEKPLTEADLAPYRQLRETFRGPLFKFGSIKGFLDGTVDARTAAMFHPYVGGGTGIPFWEQDDLNQTVALYDQEGFQVMLHAIGDRAINMALNAFEYAQQTNRTSGRRHRIEHVEVPAAADLPRFRQLGVIASTQAMFANPDDTTLKNFAAVLGPERAAHADDFKQFDDAGAVQAFGSDWPVFSDQVLPAIYCAVTRMTPQGTPAGGWYPGNRISVAAALRHFTRDGAYASFDENVRGTLSPGKLADFVVLSQDLLKIAPQQILQTRVLLTVMGGRDTYRAPDFP